MVFTQLEILQGYIVTVEAIKKFLEKATDINDEDFYFDVVDVFNKTVAKTLGLKLYIFPCCSKNQGKLYYLGNIVKKYKRKLHRCEDCTKYSVCDSCIGSTSNGFYDVDKIINEPVKVDWNNLCMYCYHDHRYPNFVFCNECGRKQETPHTYIPPVFDLKQLTGDQEAVFYYRVNDCLSCT